MFRLEDVYVVELLTFLKAERFHKFGLTATAVNADVYNQQLHKVRANDSSFQ